MGPPLANPWLVYARHQARLHSEAHGWTTQMRRCADRGLIAVLSGHASGERVRRSDLATSERANKIFGPRLAGILDLLGLLDDDRLPALDTWITTTTRGLPPGIRDDVHHWLTVLRDGTPRHQPKSPLTVYNHLHDALPALTAWSGCYQHLRQVTRSDVAEIADALHGHARKRTMSALRSLFLIKSTGRIFRDPTSGINGGTPAPGLLVPLDQTATIEQMRTDRQLDEALPAGPDPLHLAAVFGISHQTAIRYAHAARQLLTEQTTVLAGRAVAAASPGPAPADRRGA